MRLTRLVGLAALAVAPLAGAQDVTEEEFLSGLTAESAAVRALSEGVARAEGARQQAGVLANPRVDFWRETPDAHPRVTNWTLAWTPPLDGRYGLGKQAADAGLAAARERLAADKAALRREIRAAFAAWSLAFERRGTARRLLDRVRTLAEAERQRARVGEESRLKARRFTLAEAEVKAALATVEASLAAAEAVARAWRPDLAPDATPALLVPPDPPAAVDPESAPELQALAFEAEQATLERKRAGRFLTFPTLQLGWQQIDDAGAGRSGPIFAAGWSVPLFDRDQGGRAAAEGRRLAATARLEVARVQLAARVAGSAAAYRSLVAASRDAARVAGDAEHVMTGATAAYSAGEGSLTDLFDSLRSATGAQLGEIDLRAQAMESHRELEAALGRPLVGGGF
jgi:outer membrane protein TolC